MDFIKKYWTIAKGYFKLPKREVVIVHEYKYLIHFRDEPMSGEERTLFKETAPLHLKVIRDKYKAQLAYLNDHRQAENDSEKWKTQKLIQVGGVKVLEELIAYYSDTINPPQPKGPAAPQTDKW